MIKFCVVCANNSGLTYGKAESLNVAIAGSILLYHLKG
jgi:hypothetical protein